MLRLSRISLAVAVLLSLGAPVLAHGGEPTPWSLFPTAALVTISSGAPSPGEPVTLSVEVTNIYGSPVPVGSVQVLVLGADSQSQALSVYLDSTDHHHFSVRFAWPDHGRHLRLAVRDADRLWVGSLAVPGTETLYEARVPLTSTEGSAGMSWVLAPLGGVVALVVVVVALWIGRSGGAATAR